MGLFWLATRGVFRGGILSVYETLARLFGLQNVTAAQSSSSSTHSPHQVTWQLRPECESRVNLRSDKAGIGSAPRPPTLSAG